LPKEFRAYHTEDNANQAKDLSEQICTNMIFFIDEYQPGKKSDSSFKKLMSQHELEYRPPYARRNIKMPRFAAYCGATNQSEVLTDTENRRLLPFKMVTHDFDVLDSIDRENLLIEAIREAQAGEPLDLNVEQINQLKEATAENVFNTIEDDLVQTYVMKCDRKDGQNRATLVSKITHAEGGRIRINPNALSKALKKAGFETKKFNGARLYDCKFDVDKVSVYNPENQHFYNN
jgi:predicted P-loop ATPase